MIIVLDFETTGLLNPDSVDPNMQPGIVQIGAVKYDLAWNEIGFIDQLINPEAFFQEKAQEITGIKPSDVKDKPTFREALPEFAEFFVGCRHLVGFNTNYDIMVLWYNLLRYGFETRFPWPWKHHDLMKITKDYVNEKGKRDTKYIGLAALHNYLFDKGFDKAHNAVHDARATGRCAAELAKRGLMFGM